MLRWFSYFFHQIFHYYSPACLHGHHPYCQAKEGMVGRKKPMECKFCGAKCKCKCHY